MIRIVLRTRVASECSDKINCHMISMQEHGRAVWVFGAADVRDTPRLSLTRSDFVVPHTAASQCQILGMINHVVRPYWNTI